MKNKIILFSILCTLFSVACVKEQGIMPEEAKFVNVIDEDTALRNFSVALSKAVCSEQPVREFLKREALKQVDNDYDVFYPFVKSTQVDENRTFRDVICQYLDGDVNEIENAVPTLTILVPDMTWLDPQGFCAKNWDTSDQRAAVTYRRAKSNNKELFVNGYELGEIEDGAIPGGTVLVVKSNERIVADAKTKSGEQTFRFIADAFDPSKNEPVTKDIRYTGKYSFEWIKGQDNAGSANTMSESSLNKINPDIIKAYEYFKDNPYACQNDYIYYGMTSNETKGQLKTNVRPTLVRFKVNPNSFDALFDDRNGDKPDVRFSNLLDTDDNGGKRSEPTLDDIYNALWADGALEIEIDIYIGDTNGKIGLHDRKFYDVKARDLFTVKEKAISKETWGSTMFKWYVTWQYKMTRRDETTLDSIWYYPTDPITFPTWDLVTNSAYSVWVFEVDSGVEVDKTLSFTTKKANKGSAKLDVSGGIGTWGTVKIGLGWEGSDEKTSTETFNIKWVNNNDDMGSFHVMYADKCITAKHKTPLPLSSSYYYDVPSYTTGSRFTCTILPCKY